MDDLIERLELKRDIQPSGDDGRELAALLDEAIAELRRVRDDAARLDWLADRDNTIGNVQLPTVCVMNNLHDMRAAIDEAMQLDQAAWDEVGGADAGEPAKEVRPPEEVEDRDDE